MVMRPTFAKLTTIVALLMLTVPLAVGAQPAGKVYRVGILGNKVSDPAEAHLWQALRLGLRERGWIEGGNMLIEYRWAEGNFARLPELAADLVRLKVDLIVARASIWVQAAKEATSSIPIVFVVHADPVGLGHVASLAKPGGNITGLSEMSQDTEAKRLELLTATDPRIKRVAVLWNPDTPSHPPRLKAVEEAGRTLRLQLQVIGARTEAELEGAFSSMARQHAQAVLVLSSAFVLAEPDRVGHEAPAADDVRTEGACGSWRPDELRSGFCRSLPAQCHLCRQDLEGRETRRSPRRAADQVRTGD